MARIDATNGNARGDEVDWSEAAQRIGALNIRHPYTYKPEQKADDEHDDFELVNGQQLPVREDQVENNAGGFVFKVSDETRVRRFLILGTSAGTYYVTQKELQAETLAELDRILTSGRGDLILREIEAINKDNRAPKRDFMIYALALCARFGFKDATKEQSTYVHALNDAAFGLMHRVCRIATNLFMFMKHAEKISQKYLGTTGWGRMMRDHVSMWYTSKSPKQLSVQATKYRNREGYTHRDALRLCHAKPRSCVGLIPPIYFDFIFHYITKGNLSKDTDCYSQTDIDALQASQTMAYLNAVVRAGALTANDGGECADLVRKHGLVREHVPTPLLNSADVWDALLESMPMTAMIRNLAKMSTLGLFADTDEGKTREARVVNALTSEETLKKAGIHPMAVLIASSVYKGGQGVRGKLEFTPNERIIEALDKAFLLAFKNVEPTGKRFCLALDVSGSMGQAVAGSVLQCYEAEIGMAMVTKATEKCDVVAFSDSLTELPVTASTSYDDFAKEVYKLNFTATDCALPMLWATEKKRAYDVFIVFTDNETWFGNVHPFKALQQYREASGIRDARLIVCAFTSTQFSIADPTDPLMMDICGFDSATPRLISDFVLGRV